MAEAAKPEWMGCESRAPWIRNSLKVRISEMRKAERNCRTMFEKPWMGEPATHLADIYREAAELFERRLSEITPTTEPQQ